VIAAEWSLTVHLRQPRCTLDFTFRLHDPEASPLESLKSILPAAKETILFQIPASEMPPCQVCQGLVKPPGKPRLFLEFTPAELRQSALQQKCEICDTLLNGISEMQDGTWWFVDDVSRVYGYAFTCENATLTLEIYFSDDRPRVTLEFYRYLDLDGMFLRC